MAEPSVQLADSSPLKCKQTGDVPSAQAPGNVASAALECLHDDELSTDMAPRRGFDCGDRRRRLDWRFDRRGAEEARIRGKDHRRRAERVPA